MTDQPIHVPETQSEVVPATRMTDQSSQVPETQSEVAKENTMTDQPNSGSRDLASMVREGREGDVVEYLTSANRCTEDWQWQRELDECVVIAIRNKKPGIMRHLIDVGADLDQFTYGDGTQPLLYDVFRSGDTTMLDIFLAHFKGDLIEHIHYSCGVYLLNAAVESRSFEFMKRACSLLGELNIELGQHYRCDSPLHKLVDYHPSSFHDASSLMLILEEIIEFFLDKGFDINCTDDRGRTPLHVAAREGNMAGIRALMKHGADPFAQDERGGHPCAYACTTNQCDAMQELLQGFALDEHRKMFEALLHKACRNRGRGWEPVVECLLDRGVDVNCTDGRNRTPLIQAAQNKHFDIVQFLVKHKLCDVNFDSGAAISNVWCSVYISIDEGCQYYDSAGNSLDRVEDSCKIVEPVIRCLVEAGASLNLPDHKGHTLLMNGYLFSEKRYRDMLLQYGADVNIVAGDGRSVLWTAVNLNLPCSNYSDDSDDSTDTYYDDCEVQLLGLTDLLAHNIDIGVSQHQHEGMTTLQGAFHQCQPELCNILLDAECSLYGMRGDLNSIQEEEELDEDMKGVRARILEMFDQPYSLKAQARLAVLKTIGQCDLKEILHRIHHSRLLPKALVSYLGKTIKFNVDTI